MWFVGSGIFISPKGVLLGTGSVGLCLVAWGVSALISLCGKSIKRLKSRNLTKEYPNNVGQICFACYHPRVGAMVMVELGLLLPLSGGSYVYLLRAFGTFPAFILIWMRVVVIGPAAQLVQSLTVAEYISRAAMDECQRTQGWTKTMAAVVISTN